jgi:hypothetical protein
MTALLAKSRQINGIGRSTEQRRFTLDAVASLALPAEDGRRRRPPAGPTLR